jgi:sortase A
MHGHVFGRLDELKRGDRILTSTLSTRAEYRVIEVKLVNPEDTQVIAPSTGDFLTLTTCHPQGSARQRLVVVAARSA